MRGLDGQAIDKGLLLLEDAPLVQWVARSIQPWVAALYISANRHFDLYGRYGLCVPADAEFGGDAGPLAGDHRTVVGGLLGGRSVFRSVPVFVIRHRA